MAPVLRSALRSENLQQLTLAGKGVGSQGDGSMQLLCASQDLQQQVRPCSVPICDGVISVHVLRQVLELLRGDLFRFDAFSLTIPASDTPPPERILIGDSRCGGMGARRDMFISSRRVDRVVLVCRSRADGAGGGLISRQLVDLLLELLACGARKISLVCQRPAGEEGTCDVFARTREAIESSALPGPEWSYDMEKCRALSKTVSFCVDSGEGEELNTLLVSSGALSSSASTSSTTRHRYNILVGLLEDMPTGVDVSSERIPRHQVVYDCLRRPVQQLKESVPYEAIGKTVLDWEGIRVCASYYVLTDEDMTNPAGTGVQTIVNVCRS